MSKSSARSVIRLKGVRHNNLKNFDLDLPLRQLIVVTGLSGSGKSSLAFDTLFAEGQRRYIETFSPYARQFFDRMDKPQVDSIEGIPPAIAIEQRNSVKTTRSTVGTMTEICDYMKLLWPHIAQLHCRKCGKPVRKDSPQSVWESLKQLNHLSSDTEILLTFDLAVSEKLSIPESLALVEKQGYQRLLFRGELVRIADLTARLQQTKARLATLTVVQDRLRLLPEKRARFVEACEQAYHFGKGKLCVRVLNAGVPTVGSELRFSNRLHCAQCDIDYREPTPALFSFNHPVGACAKCRGFGRVISIDYQLAIPDTTRTLGEGVVKPWHTGQSAECQTDLMRVCRQLEIPTNVPFEKLPKKWRDFVIEGDPEYGKDEEHQWPSAWYGVKGYFRWLESKAYKMHVRVLLSRYRAYTQCPDCKGQRFQPDALLYQIRTTCGPRSRQELASRASMNLAEFYALPIRDALKFIDDCSVVFGRERKDPLRLAAEEVRSRLGFLDEVGLGYLTLDRPTRSLSGGETERVNLTTCLGSRLVNTLFVLDEPSVGLHPRDTDRLVRVLQQLRQAGNTVVVVEHEASVMRAADQIVDLGPGHGATGGQVVFQGTFDGILRAESSLTGAYLSGRKKIDIPQPRPVALETLATEPAINGSRVAPMILKEARAPFGAATAGTTPALTVKNANRNNLKNIDVQIPLGRFVCITGVSGSGKTTLIREVLLPLASEDLRKQSPKMKASERSDFDQDSTEDEQSPASRFSGETLIHGTEHLGNVVLVDQSALGKTPRSNPAVYIGAFDDIREVFAQSELARQRGLGSSAFSFNSSQGQCQKCRGAGFEKIEMQFLSDVFIRCTGCNGRRYRDHILEVRIGEGAEAKSIADLLESTVEEAIVFLQRFPESRPARRAQGSLKYLQEVGLGYLKLGQPINTLSGGESQRLKLVRHLAEACERWETETGTLQDQPLAERPKPTLFLFDEPTTGLHFDDVRVLLMVFQRLVHQGHSVLVVEHNLDVIKCADWLIDLGPEAGEQGGEVVFAGPPSEIVHVEENHTGRALSRMFPAVRSHAPGAIGRESLLNRRAHDR